MLNIVLCPSSMPSAWILLEDNLPWHHAMLWNSRAAASAHHRRARRARGTLSASSALAWQGAHWHGQKTQGIPPGRQDRPRVRGIQHRLMYTVLMTLKSLGNSLKKDFAKENNMVTSTLQKTTIEWVFPESCSSNTPKVSETMTSAFSSSEKLKVVLWPSLTLIDSFKGSFGQRPSSFESNLTRTSQHSTNTLQTITVQTRHPVSQYPLR